MRKLPFFLALVICSYAFLAHKKAIELPNEKVRFFYSYVMISNNRIVRDTFIMYISNVGRHIIYELPYHVTNEVDDVLISDSLKYESFIFDSMANFGYSFKNYYDLPILVVNKDSFLKNRAMLGIEMNSPKSVMKSVRESEISLGAEIIHRYLFSDTLTDSAYYYYNSNKRDISFSLSKTLDSTYRSKLYRIQFFYKKGIFSAVDSGIFDGVEMEIKKVPLNNLAEMKILIEKIEKGEGEEKHSQ